MAWVYVAGAALQAYGNVAGGESQAKQYEADAEQYEHDAKVYDEKAKLKLVESSLSELQGMEALNVGSIESKKAILVGRQVEAAQNVGYGASGIRVDTGITTDIKDETDRLAYGDSVTIRKNAAKESYGYRLNAWTQRGEARTYSMSAENARRAAENSREAAERVRKYGWIAALGGGLSAASNYRGSDAANS